MGHRIYIYIYMYTYIYIYILYLSIGVLYGNGARVALDLVQQDPIDVHRMDVLTNGRLWLIDL